MCVCVCVFDWAGVGFSVKFSIAKCANIVGFEPNFELLGIVSVIFSCLAKCHKSASNAAISESF